MRAHVWVCSILVLGCICGIGLAAFLSWPVLVCHFLHLPHTPTSSSFCLHFLHALIVARIWNPLSLHVLTRQLRVDRLYLVARLSVTWWLMIEVRGR